MSESDDNGKQPPPNWAVIAQGLFGIAAFALGATFIVIYLFDLFGDDYILRDVLLALGGLVVGPAGLWLSYRRTIALDQQNKNTEKSLAQQAESERNTRLATAFTEATNQLGSDKEHIRAAACHALGQIALEDWRQAKNDKGYESAYYSTCIDILSGFLREGCKQEALDHMEAVTETSNVGDAGDIIAPFFHANYRLPVDIEAALKAVSMCNQETGGSHQIDLRNANLRCFQGLGFPVNLDRADVSGADFTGAKLVEVSLKGITASRTDFRKANLTLTDFEGSGFIWCNFENAIVAIQSAHSATFSKCRFQSEAHLAQENTIAGATFYECVFKQMLLFHDDMVNTAYNGCSFYDCSIFVNQGELASIWDCRFESGGIGCTQEFLNEISKQDKKSFTIDSRPLALQTDSADSIVEDISPYIDILDAKSYFRKTTSTASWPDEYFDPLKH